MTSTLPLYLCSNLYVSLCHSLSVPIILLLYCSTVPLPPLYHFPGVSLLHCASVPLFHGSKYAMVPLCNCSTVRYSSATMFHCFTVRLSNRATVSLYLCLCVTVTLLLCSTLPLFLCNPAPVFNCTTAPLSHQCPVLLFNFTTFYSATVSLCLCPIVPLIQYTAVLQLYCSNVPLLLAMYFCFIVPQSPCESVLLFYCATIQLHLCVQSNCASVPLFHYSIAPVCHCPSVPLWHCFSCATVSLVHFATLVTSP